MKELNTLYINDKEVKIRVKPNVVIKEEIDYSMWWRRKKSKSGGKKILIIIDYDTKIKNGVHFRIKYKDN